VVERIIIIYIGNSYLIILSDLLFCRLTSCF
jgi:hypothetical protein